MAFVSAIRKISHVVTAAESVASIVNMAISWPIPFPDTNYVISATLELVSSAVTSAFIGLRNVTPTGFTAATNANYATGDVIAFHLTASQEDSQTKKLKHVVTAAEAAAFSCDVPLLWPSPFNDTNYTVSVVVEHPTLNSSCFVHNVTPAGCSAVAGAGWVAGDTIIVHATASHK